MKRLGLDYVWLLVAPQNPLKPVAGMMPLCHRLASAQKIIGRNRRLVVTNLEQSLGSRYTIDTVRALTARWPSVQFIWLMGSDNLEQFHRWRSWHQIAERLPIAVVLRPGSTLASLRSKAMLAMGEAIVIVDGRRNETSATAIRARLAARQEA